MKSTATPSIPTAIYNNPQKHLSCCAEPVKPSISLKLSYSGCQSSSDAPAKHLSPRLVNNPSPPKHFSFYFPDDAQFEGENSFDDDEEDYTCYLEYDDDLLDSDSELEYLSSCSDDDDCDLSCDFDECDSGEEPCLNPFWFNNEEQEHMEQIFEEYNKLLVSPSEFMRSNQPFVGRIERTKACVDQNVFQTFDCVAIGNCQRVPLGKPVPIIREEYCLTSWDCDGIPISILRLNAEQTSFWSRRLSEKNSTFLFRQPEYANLQEASNSKFCCSSSPTYDDITYSGLPYRGAYSPFVRRKSFSLPPHLKEDDDF